MMNENLKQTDESHPEPNDLTRSTEKQREEKPKVQAEEQHVHLGKAVAGGELELATEATETSLSTEGTPHPSVTLPGEESDTWVNVNVDYKDRSGAMLYHPTMKMSFSDGSISYHAELEDLVVSGVVLEGSEYAPGSALSKLRNRMSNLALPDAIASPGTSRRRSNAVAMQNKIRSQIRYRECKTKIILL